VTALSLGGPGAGCSRARVRRLLAGELKGAERARTEEHLAGCARCQAVRDEAAAEDRAVREALPFETLAAGVAERLAREERPATPARATRRWVPVALAASLAVGVAVPLVARVVPAPSLDGLRAKGGPSLTVYVETSGSGRALAPGEPVAPGARLRVGLGPAGRRYAAVLLVDADGAAALYAGPARAGPLPGAFEWTGEGGGRLVAVLADVPLDATALQALLGRGGAPEAAVPGATVVTWSLERTR
jgi:hypothetical protein